MNHSPHDGFSAGLWWLLILVAAVMILFLGLIVAEVVARHAVAPVKPEAQR